MTVVDEPRVSFADDTDFDGQVAAALALLRSEGAVVLDDLVDPALIARAKAEIEANHPDYARVDPAQNYGSHPGRHTMPLPVEGAIADRAIFLPRAIRRLSEAMLGKDYVMESLGLLVSLPGAGVQGRHPDAVLFPEARIDYMVPPFALAFSLPLVPMDEITGTTAFWRRSHKGVRAEGDHDLAPIVQPGSAIVWDFRTVHCGLANVSGRPRPVIYSVLARHWWMELHPPQATRYEKFLLGRDVYDGLRPRDRRRMSRALLVDGESKVPAWSVGVRDEEKC